MILNINDQAGCQLLSGINLYELQIQMNCHNHNGWNILWGKTLAALPNDRANSPLRSNACSQILRIQINGAHSSYDLSIHFFFFPSFPFSFFSLYFPFFSLSPFFFVLAPLLVTPRGHGSQIPPPRYAGNRMPYLDEILVFGWARAEGVHAEFWV